MEIRPVTPADISAILEIYNDVVAKTTAIYSDTPYDLSDMQDYIESRLADNFPFFIAEDESQIIGYGTYGTFRSRHGYRFTVEHSVHVAEAARGKGVGKALLTHLIHHAKSHDYHLMIGAIDKDNIGSIRFHEQHGFKIVGDIPEAAYKFDRWLTLIFMSLKLTK